LRAALHGNYSEYNTLARQEEPSESGSQVIHNLP
jgi:hypothetical protein